MVPIIFLAPTNTIFRQRIVPPLKTVVKGPTSLRPPCFRSIPTEINIIARITLKLNGIDGMPDQLISPGG